ncbi:hypothetical protein HEQ60_10300 [Haematospirillum sp. H1815]|uniref:hypothetical protein n=1 Tax=Haematospirillum sp. H1815 TaxID=2723108 RepID=UPI00143C9C72|nr:hypothetical protein [Haematospirillum sp. H1815]NKD78147.1 hypothetical protein [Haematospirillum sp. H1815]
MAAVISGITLYREKSTVHRFDFSGEHRDEDAIFQVRSNRVSLVLKSGPVTEHVIIRGQNIPTTLRMTALVVEQFNRNPALFTEDHTTSFDWAEHWKSRVSSYERQFMEESWISIYHEGGTLFSTNPSAHIDEIERIALGGDINDSHIKKVSQSIVGAIEDVVTQHDSQTAVVFTPFKEYHRAAILERRGGRTGSFATSAYHPPKPGRPVRYSGFINFCADAIEALNLKVFLERVKQMVEENKSYSGAITAVQVAAAMARKRDLMQFIQSYERANKVVYRPERPEFV